MKHIIKRKGHKEPYDERKLYASIFASCMSLRIKEEQAELIANTVTSEVEEKIRDKEEIAAHDLFSYALSSLKKYNPDAAFLYKKHREVS